MRSRTNTAISIFDEEYQRLFRLIDGLLKRFQAPHGQPSKLPPLEWVRAHYKYNPDTGRLFRILKDGSLKPAGGDYGKGYIRVDMRIRGVRYRATAHRIAWALHYGEPPPHDMVIDHINGDRSDNRIKNLRILRASTNIYLGTFAKQKAPVHF